MKKFVVRSTAIALITAGALFAGASAATASDYVYVGTRSDGAGGHFFHYRNAEGQSVYSDRWLGIVYKTGDSLLPM